MASAANKRNLNPKETVTTESLETMNNARSRMSARDFREALTRAQGSVVGVKTEALQNNRWSI